MNYFYSFNSELFTSKKEDYRIVRQIQDDGCFFETVFVPLEVKCAVRIGNLVHCDLELLENETEINQLVNHPNILKILISFLTLDGDLYTVMPLSPFESLDVLSKPYGVSEPIIGFIMNDLLTAVDYLHQNNIIHR